MAYKEFGEELLDRVAEDLEDIAKIETENKFVGRRLTMTMINK